MCKHINKLMNRANQSAGMGYAFSVSTQTTAHSFDM